MIITKFLKDISFYIYYILFYLFIGIMFAGIGAYNSEEIYGRYKVVLALELLITLSLLKNVFILKTLKPLPFVVCIWILWMILNSLNMIMFGAEYYYIVLMDVLFCPLIFLYFYVIIVKKPNLIKDANHFHIILLLFSFVLYIFVYNYKNTGNFNSSPVLNASYYLLLLLPWILIVPNKIYRNIGIIIIAIAVIISMKRTATIAFVFSLFVYYLLEQKRLKGLLSLKLILQILIVTVAMYIVYSYYDLMTGGYFEQRLSSSLDDRGSGRLDIYINMFKLLNMSTFGEWLYGHGHDTARIYNAINNYDALSAHNDWIEIIFDYGMLGLIIYFMFHYYLIKHLLLLIKKHSFYGPPMAVSYTILFVMSMTSHLVLYATYYAYLMSFWGAISALSLRGDKKNKYNTI